MSWNYLYVVISMCITDVFIHIKNINLGQKNGKKQSKRTSKKADTEKE